jgi:hypothetical protein
MRAGQDQRPDPVRRGQRGFLGHHAPERLSVQVRTVDPEVIKEGDRVVDERGHGHRGVWCHRPPVPPVIEYRHAEVRREPGDVPSPPRDVPAEALEEQHRLAVAVHLVVQPAPVESIEERHPC